MFTAPMQRLSRQTVNRLNLITDFSRFQLCSPFRKVSARLPDAGGNYGVFHAKKRDNQTVHFVKDSQLFRDSLVSNQISGKLLKSVVIVFVASLPVEAVLWLCTIEGLRFGKKHCKCPTTHLDLDCDKYSHAHARTFL